MELRNVLVAFTADNRWHGASLEGIITATHNHNGGGIFVQAPGKEPVRIDFDQILSLTILS